MLQKWSQFIMWTDEMFFDDSIKSEGCIWVLFLFLSLENFLGLIFYEM